MSDTCGLFEQSTTIFHGGDYTSFHVDGFLAPFCNQMSRTNFAYMNRLTGIVYRCCLTKGRVVIVHTGLYQQPTPKLIFKKLGLSTLSFAKARLTCLQLPLSALSLFDLILELRKAGYFVPVMLPDVVLIPFISLNVVTSIFTSRFPCHKLVYSPLWFCSSNNQITIETR